MARSRFRRVFWLTAKSSCSARSIDSLDVRRVVVADARRSAGGADQVAQYRLALDDAAVVDGVDGGGRQVDQARQVGRAADLFERPVALENL